MDENAGKLLGDAFPESCRSPATQPLAQEGVGSSSWPAESLLIAAKLSVSNAPRVAR
jgi:hypothetical protein